MRKLMVGLGAITMAASLIVLRPSTARAELDSELIGWRHGCWFYEGDTPACNICADSCNPGQKCCWIIAF